MNKLIEFINSLSMEERFAFAEACGTSLGYLRKACSKKQLLGAPICVAIERASNGSVTRKHLHPDDWANIWPELSEYLMVSA